MSQENENGPTQPEKLVLEIQEPKPKRVKKEKKSPEPLQKVKVRLYNGEAWEVVPLAVDNGLAVTPLVLVGGFESPKKWVITHIATGAQLSEVFDRKTRIITAMLEIARLAQWELDPVNYAREELRGKIAAICTSHQEKVVRSPKDSQNPESPSEDPLPENPSLSPKDPLPPSSEG